MSKFMKYLRKISVQKRMTISFSIVVGLSSIAAIVAMILLLFVNHHYSNALKKNGFIQGDIGYCATYLNEERILIRDVVMLTDPNAVKAKKEALAKADEKIAFYFQEMFDKLQSAEEKSIAQDMIANLEKYHSLRQQILSLSENGNKVDAFLLLQGEAGDVAHALVQDAEKLLSLNVEMGDWVSDSMNIYCLILLLVIVIVLIAVTIIGMGFAKYTAADIADPIEKMRSATKKLAIGELDTQVEILDENEFGEMADDFNAATSKLQEYIECIDYGLTEISHGNFTVRPTVTFLGEFESIKRVIENIVSGLSRTMHQINDGSEQVALGAQQLAESAQQLAEGASNQAEIVEELTATMEHAASSAKDSAKKADEAYQNAQKFTIVAQNSSQDMQLLTQAMERITATSKEIANIITEIEEIASQTNLLSLNASIEAARAGEAGRGFAVVADQIGKLATDSAQSAINTKNLIVNALQEIQNGNEITSKTTSALSEVMDGIQFLADNSKDTSEISKEQAESILQIRTQIEQIASVAQNNAAVSQETSATSEELLAQSESLKIRVEQFQLLDK